MLRTKPRRLRLSAWLPALGLLLLSACSHHRSHPVIRGAWGGGGPRGAAHGTAPDPAVDQALPWEARRAFFADMGRLDERIDEVRALLTPDAKQPVHRPLREASRALLARMGPRGPLGGRLRNALVFGAVGRLPLSARDAAGLWLDPGAQGAALGTRGFRTEGVVFGLPDSFRQAARVEILDVGTKPLTFDLVFGTYVEVKELFDKTVLLRYDPRAVAGERHVSLWRGGCVFEPDPAAPGGRGCIATEVVVFGTDIHLPLLEGLLRREVESAFATRAERFWKLAAAVAAKQIAPR